MRDKRDLASGPSVNLGPDIKVKVGQQLRVMYGEIMDQGVPDRCIEILKRLDEPEDGARNHSGRSR
jgi:hypothetical protein